MERLAVVRADVVGLALLVSVLLGLPLPRAIDPTDSGEAAQDSMPASLRRRAADLPEMASLRSHAGSDSAVASPAAATPGTPGATEATPAPLLSMGQAISYPGNWVVTITGASLRPTIDDLPGQGPFVQVEVELTNLADRPRVFRFRDWVIVDAAGRVYRLSEKAVDEYESRWFKPIPPSLPDHVSVLFAVAADAGDRFVIDSMANPSFRVQLELAARG